MSSTRRRHITGELVNVFGLTGGALTAALSQLNGEVATGAERSSFQLTNEFLSLMLDPFVNGRGYVGGAGFGGPSSAMPGCASGEQTSVSADAAIFRLSPPAAKDCGLRGVYEPRWSAWGSAFGGSTSANGNTAAGSNNITANTFGFAGGMDYRVTPNTLFGFALAGAGTNSGLLQLARHRTRRRVRGRHLRHQLVRASLCGRCALFHQQLVHDQSLGARRPAQREFLGANLRRARRRRLSLRRAATLGVTPYGAVQFQDFYTPAYSESDVGGGGFGLSYASTNATDVRTELGSRFDAPTIVYGKPVILYGRLAWAHDL